MLTIIRYLSLFIQVKTALDSFRYTGISQHMIRGVKYEGQVLDIDLTVYRRE